MRLCVKRALFSLLLALAPTSLYADSPPEHRAAEPEAEPVTEENLLASERFWPYHVELTKPWQGAGRKQPLPAGTMGVLIRIEASGLARIDFGRDGLSEVQVGMTDLLERANRIRTGGLRKMAPNFVLAIGPRLVDSAGDSLRPYLVGAVFEQRGFLTVFADPDAEGFGALAKELAPLSKRKGVLTILVPVGEHPDAQLRERLRSVGWTVPFVYDHLADSYVRSLLPEKTPQPAIMLQTNEGRVLFQSGWNADVVPKLSAAIAGEAEPPSPERHREFTEP